MPRVQIDREGNTAERPHPHQIFLHAFAVSALRVLAFVMIFLAGYLMRGVIDPHPEPTLICPEPSCLRVDEPPGGTECEKKYRYQCALDGNTCHVGTCWRIER